MLGAKRLPWIHIAIITIALLLLAIGAAIMILNSLGSLSVLITAIFAAFGVMISFFQLLPLLLSSKKHMRPTAIQPPPTQSISQQLLSVDTAVHHSIIGLPPPTYPKTIQQREKTVKAIYEKLLQSDITAIVLTGMGGVGKSTLAALVYRYAEEQRQSGFRLFHGRSIWLTINDSVTMTDLAGTLFESLNNPMCN